MKKLIVLPLTICILLVGATTTIAQEKGKMMQPTSSSEKAVDFYYQSIEAAENAELTRSLQLMNKALEEDPDFFMAHYQLALRALYSGNRENLEQHLEKALENEDDLNDAELQLKEALSRMEANPDADLTAIGEKLVEMYPEDKTSYYTLAVFQARNGDLKGAAATYEKGIEKTNNPAPLYNMLGYTYMRDGNMEKAEKAFDKYIELNPHHPNPYDSKGDFYMQNKEYAKAYDSYMKAHALNPEWSYEKAEEAKKMMNEQSSDSGAAATNLPLKPGNLIGTHIIKVQLKDGATMEEWQDYYTKNILPEIPKTLVGWKAYLLKGIRGENKDQLGILYVIPSEKERDKYFNDDGSMNENGSKSMEKIQPKIDELNKKGEFSTVYTDWLVVD